MSHAGALRRWVRNGAGGVLALGGTSRAGTAFAVGVAAAQALPFRQSQPRKSRPSATPSWIAISLEPVRGSSATFAEVGATAAAGATAVGGATTIGGALRTTGGTVTVTGGTRAGHEPSVSPCARWAGTADSSTVISWEEPLPSR